MDTKRIDHLLTPGALEGKRVVVVGLGSGGFPTLQHLAMCGVSDWAVFDMDDLDSVNLVKHPAMRRDLGRRKTEIAEEWIVDRNPEANVDVHDVDITTEEGEAILSAAIASASVVVCCTDNQPTRELVNIHSVDHSTPCVWAVIHRTGYGGDVFLYDPDTPKMGCFKCLHMGGTEVSVGRMLEDAKLASSVESPIEDVRYGREPDPKYGLSGLVIDIQFISMFQSRLALAVLLEQRMDASFYATLSQDPILATQAEDHMLRLPYDYRGPNPPSSVIGKKTWWDTENSVRKGFDSGAIRCTNCKSRVEEEDYYCGDCGFALYEEGDEEREEEEYSVADSPRAEVKRSDWRQIGTPSGYGFNYIMFNNRRQIVDERIINDEGETEITGNTQVALHPFNLKQVTVLQHPDCTVCWEGDE